MNDEPSEAKGKKVSEDKLPLDSRWRKCKRRICLWWIWWFGSKVKVWIYKRKDGEIAFEIAYPREQFRELREQATRNGRTIDHEAAMPLRALCYQSTGEIPKICRHSDSTVMVSTKDPESKA